MDDDVAKAPPPTLDALVEIRVPEPVSYAPDTPAWTALFVFVGLLLAVAALLLWRRWKRNAYRRAGLARLDAIAASGAWKDLPVLVKRIALESWPREQVAELSGDPWLAFLDASYGGAGFTSGPGRRLPDLAYSDADVPDAGTAELVALVRAWIRTHRVRGLA